MVENHASLTIPCEHDELTQVLKRSSPMLDNPQLPQSALGSKTPLQAMQDWQKLKPELFGEQPYFLAGCDS